MITCVIQFLFALLVLLEIVDFNLQQEAVCVSIEKLTLVTVMAFELVVAKIVHQYFSVVENRHRGITRLVQFRTLFVYFETSKIVRKQCATGKQRTRNQLANLFPFITANYFDVTALLHVLHRFPEHGVVHVFVEAVLEFAFGQLPEFCVHLSRLVATK